VPRTRPCLCVVTLGAPLPVHWRRSLKEEGSVTVPVQTVLQSSHVNTRIHRATLSAALSIIASFAMLSFPVRVAARGVLRAPRFPRFSQHCHLSSPRPFVASPPECPYHIRSSGFGNHMLAFEKCVRWRVAKGGGIEELCHLLMTYSTNCQKITTNLKDCSGMG